MPLDEDKLRLARDARLVLLSPRAAVAPLAAGLHTTIRDGARVATALWRTFAGEEGGGQLEVLTFVRSRFGEHAATWTDLPDLDVAVIVYADRWGAPIELVAEPIAP